jgi:hypothetical protein
MLLESFEPASGFNGALRDILMAAAYAMRPQAFVETRPRVSPLKLPVSRT